MAANSPHSQQKHDLTGRCNTDDSPVSPVTDWSKDFRYALNLRFAITGEGNDGVVENVRGTVAIANSDLDTYTSASISETRSCGIHTTGPDVTYTLGQAAFTSQVSQADADAQAQAYFDSTKEAFFTANLVCTPDVVVSFNVGATQATALDACGDSSLGAFYTYDNPLIVGSEVFTSVTLATHVADGYYRRAGFTYVYHTVGGFITEILPC